MSRYNRQAVDQAIASSNRHGRKIAGGEARLIHALLKGRDVERDRQVVELGASAPLQSKGKPVKDAGELPLFIAGNEPTLF